MLQEVLQDDYFLQVSSARILVNISGTVRAINLNLLQVKDIRLSLYKKKIKKIVRKKVIGKKVCVAH
jgi:hypothetical protein